MKISLKYIYREILAAGVVLSGLFLSAPSSNATPTYEYINLPTTASTSSSGFTNTIAFSINDNGLVSSSASYSGSGAIGGKTHSFVATRSAPGYVFWILRTTTSSSGGSGYYTDYYRVMGAFYQRNTRSWEVREIGGHAGGGAYSMNPYWFEFFDISVSLTQVNWTARSHRYGSTYPSSTDTSYSYDVPTQNPAPVFTLHPSPATVSAGQNVTFRANATGAISYQWKKNGGNLPGQTSTTLALSNVQTTDSGTYSVVATNQGGSSDESNGALLTVTANAPIPAIIVDGYSSGTYISRPAGGSVNVTVRYAASDSDSDLAGIRYNIWNATTGYFDNGNDGFILQSGGSGLVIRTVSLSADGDWFFWTDAVDSVGNYASTGDWDRGFHLVVASNHAPVTSISGPTSLSVGAVGSWSFSATDQDGNLSRWRLSLLPNSARWSSISGSSQTGTLNYSFSSAGTYTFRVEAEDTNGAAASPAEISVTVR